MADRATGAAALEAHGIIEFKRGQGPVYLLVAEISGVEPEALAPGTVAAAPMVNVRMRGGGAVRESGTVEEIRERWIAALSGKVVDDALW